MTPKFDRRCAVVLASPYWRTVDGQYFDVGEVPEDKRNDIDALFEEKSSLQDAIRDVDDYDDLSADMKARFDRAESAVMKAKAEHEDTLKRILEEDRGFICEDLSGPGAAGWLASAPARTAEPPVTDEEEDEEEDED